ncbi:hypothetical protein ACTFIW_000448, partial [Dictyostelium discoideum]
MPLSGGLSTTKPADKTIEDIVNSTKAAIQTKLGSKNVTVVSYKTQVVNGTNYFVKVKTDNGYAHLRIYKPFSGSPNKINLNYYQEHESFYNAPIQINYLWQVRLTSSSSLP